MKLASYSVEGPEENPRALYIAGVQFTECLPCVIKVLLTGFGETRIEDCPVQQLKQEMVRLCFATGIKRSVFLALPFYNFLLLYLILYFYTEHKNKNMLSHYIPGICSGISVPLPLIWCPIQGGMSSWMPPQRLSGYRCPRTPCWPGIQTSGGQGLSLSGSLLSPAP